MLTFATPFKKRVLEKGNILISSLKRLKTVQASTEKNTIYREALILLFRNYKCQRQA